jgi:hypothetical protein
MAADRGTGSVAPNKRTTGVRTWGGSADRPQGRVVAEVAPKQDFQYSGGESSQQNIRRAEANAAPFVSWSDLDAEANAIVDNAMTTPGGAPSGGTDYWSTLLKSLQGGSGGGAPKLSAADVSLQELKYKMEQDALDRADALKALNKQEALTASQIAQMQNQLATGGYRSNVDAILNMLANSQTNQEASIKGIFDKAISGIGQGYNEASTLMGQGYDILDQYLKDNPNDPYAGLRAQLAPVQNPMEQFLSAYGVSSPEVQAQVAAEQLAGQQGAGAFNTLADLLSKASQQADKSRALEALMARRGGVAGLGQQKAALASQAEVGQAQALAQLQQQIAQAKLEQEMSAENARQDLINRIIQSGGTLTGSGPSGTPTAVERAIAAAGGTTNEAQFQQGLDELAAALGAIGFQG